MSGPFEALVVAALEGLGEATVSEIVAECGCHRHDVSRALAALVCDGSVVSCGYGVFTLCAPR